MQNVIIVTPSGRAVFDPHLAHVIAILELIRRDMGVSLPAPIPPRAFH